MYSEMFASVASEKIWLFLNEKVDFSLKVPTFRMKTCYKVVSAKVAQNSVMYQVDFEILSRFQNCQNFEGSVTHLEKKILSVTRGVGIKKVVVTRNIIYGRSLN